MSTDRAGNDRRGDHEPADGGEDGLAMRVVEYPDAHDRCTVYPPALDDHERMTHWLSADRDAFLALERWR